MKQGGKTCIITRRTGGGASVFKALIGFTLADQAEPGPRQVFTRFAFTLAETLITLGIIGVVAALTMPALVANYQKKVLETRIKKFYSVMQQAVNMKKAEDGALDGSMLAANFSPAEMTLFFDTNYKPYLKTISVDAMTRGIIAGFPDGFRRVFAKNGCQCWDRQRIYDFLCQL
jgi:type II secretory pathway pseudopilin PulG